MVKSHHGQDSSGPRSLRFSVEEEFIMSKTGNPADCEDAVYLGEHFVAVIDGATAKSCKRWDGQTGGRFGAGLVKEALARLPGDATIRQAAECLTATLYDAYQSQGEAETVRADPVHRIAVSLAAFSLHRREVWLIGDCQCLLDEERIGNDKAVDRVTAEARALFLQAELLKGASIEELRRQDRGREFIQPLLARQSLLQNNPAAGEFRYAVVDGFPIPEDGLISRRIPKETGTFILATDGYPDLRSTLAESERALQAILQDDPMLCRSHKSTKGLVEGNVSFDDRAYLKLRLTNEF